MTRLKKTLLIAGSLLLLSSLGLLAVGYWSYQNLPDVSKLTTCFTTSMNQVRLCPNNRNYVPLSQISELAVDAIVLSEDAAFYGHEGFDWHEIKESIERNLEEGGFARGGSTITQQLAKNAFLSSDKTLTRKFKEAFLAHQIEDRFSKNTILEKYLNLVELGPDIYGIKQAAYYYFDKHPRNLNALEGAFLAFLLPNPRGYHQSFEEKQLTSFAKKRVLHILYLLKHYKRIGGSTYQASKEYVDLFPWSQLTAADFENYMPDLPPSSSDWEDMPTPEEIEKERRRVRAELHRAIDKELKDLEDPAEAPPVEADGEANDTITAAQEADVQEDDETKESTPETEQTLEGSQPDSAPDTEGLEPESSEDGLVEEPTTPSEEAQSIEETEY